MCKVTTVMGKMIVQGIFLTGGEASFFVARAEVKTKAYEASETNSDNTQVLNTLVSSFRTAAKIGQGPERSKLTLPRGVSLNKPNPL